MQAFYQSASLPVQQQPSALQTAELTQPCWHAIQGEIANVVHNSFSMHMGLAGLGACKQGSSLRSLLLLQSQHDGRILTLSEKGRALNLGIEAISSSSSSAELFTLQMQRVIQKM